MTVYLVISLPKIPYTHRIYMVLANPTYFTCCKCCCLNFLPFHLPIAAPSSMSNTQAHMLPLHNSSLLSHKPTCYRSTTPHFLITSLHATAPQLLTSYSQAHMPLLHNSSLLNHKPTCYRSAAPHFLIASLHMLPLRSSSLLIHKPTCYRSTTPQFLYTSPHATAPQLLTS